MVHDFIDWDKTAQNLKLLRGDNLQLRKFVCKALRFEEAECSGECESCKFDMDNSISQTELAEVFGVSAGVIANWETGRTYPDLNDLLFYAYICNIPLSKVVVLKNCQNLLV